jgi:hypothetical protein
MIYIASPFLCISSRMRAEDRSVLMKSAQSFQAKYELLLSLGGRGDFGL